MPTLANRVLSERLTTMLDESGLAKAFWGEALGALVHVWNRCPTDAVKNATPYQLWNGTKPDVSHLRVWGCTAYVHIQKDKRAGLIQITLGDDSQCTVLLCIYLITDLGDDSQCTRGKAVQLQIKYLSG